MSLTEQQQVTVDGVSAKLEQAMDEVYDAMVEIALRDPERSGEVAESLQLLDRRYQAWVLASLDLVRECDRLTRTEDPDEEEERGDAEITDRSIGQQISDRIISDFLQSAAAHAEMLRKQGS